MDIRRWKINDGKFKKGSYLVSKPFCPMHWEESGHVESKILFKTSHWRIMEFRGEIYIVLDLPYDP